MSEEMQIASSLRGTVRRHPGRWAVAAVAAAGMITFALWWFTPWNLFVDRRVNEALPSAGSAVEEPAGTTGEAVAAAGSGDSVDGGTFTLAEGELQDLAHATSGTVLVVELEDGSRFLRLQGLDTTNGPDLRVVLTDQPVSSDPSVWDDGELVDLGPLKGNVGSSNYEIPTGLDLSGFRTAVIWCRRFSVGFGVAAIESEPN